MLGYHVRIRPKNSDHLGSTREERRMIARSVLERGREFGLTSFGLGLQHLHMHPFCERKGAGELSRRVSLSLLKPLGLEAGFEPPYIEPIKSMRHAYNTFTYHLEQERHHGLPEDRRGEGSNLPDLLGLRLIGAYTLDNVKRYLPRIDRQQLLSLFGASDLAPAAEPLEQVVEAGLSAAALPSIEGRSIAVLELRRALIQVYDGRVVDTVLAENLRVSARTLRRLKSRPANPSLVHAIRLQLALRNRR